MRRVPLALRALAAALAVCASSAALPAAEETPATLGERRLLQILEREEALFRELNRRSDDPDQAVRDNEERAQRLVRDYEGLTREFPELAAGWVAYGRFLQKSGYAKEAAAIFMKALQLNPELPVANQQLGNWYAGNDEPAKAVPLLLRAIDQAPSQPVYHYDLGSILFAHRDKLVAEGVMERPALDAQMLRAFSRAAELAPDNLDLAFRHAEALGDIEKPDWEQVLKAWHAIELKVRGDSLEHDAVLLNLARAQIELGRPEEARKLLAEVSVESPLASARRSLEARLSPPPEVALPKN